MKYEVPVCEMLEFCTEDVITTSVTGSEAPSYGDTAIVPKGGVSIYNDGGIDGGAN